MVMRMDCLRKQSLNLRQSKDGFRKSVELHLCQSLYRGGHTFHGGSTGDEPVRALSSFSFLAVGNAIFILLHFVLKLSKLPFTGCPLSFQLG